MTSPERTVPDYLLAEGFNAHFQSDGNIAFYYEDYLYQLCFDARDPEFGHLVLPLCWKVSDSPLLNDVLECVDLVNRSLKVAKAYTRSDQVSFAIEIWLGDQADWSRYLQRALRILDYARAKFSEHMAIRMAAHAAIPIEASIH